MIGCLCGHDDLYLHDKPYLHSLLASFFFLKLASFSISFEYDLDLDLDLLSINFYSCPSPSIQQHSQSLVLCFGDVFSHVSQQFQQILIFMKCILFNYNLENKKSNFLSC